jgi:hemoglobin
MYPEDLTQSKSYLAGFLVQYWGGPQTYSEERGHPRLRMRHFPFVIGVEQAAAWYRHMEAAVLALDVDDTARPILLEYFERAAHAMINVDA